MEDGWLLVRYVHLLALALFVGGQLMLIAVVAPVARGHDDVMRPVARRFAVATVLALAALLVTGIAMASHYDRWSDDKLQAKLALLVLAGVLIGLHVAAPRSRALATALLVVSALVVWFGVALSH